MEPEGFITLFTRARHVSYPEPDTSSSCPLQSYCFNTRYEAHKHSKRLSDY
jgi:hypothetical protein